MIERIINQNFRTVVLKIAIVGFLAFHTNSVVIAQQLNTQIKLNQIGFYPNASKIAAVTGDVQSSIFYITSTNFRDTFLRGTLGDPRQSLYSKTATRLADFSALKRQGSYVVLLPGLGHSYVFQINDNVHRDVAIASMKSYYFQRISMPLEYKYAGKWHRSAGHPDTIVYIHSSAASIERPEGTVVSSPGGWYDAGDYNKYIVNSGISMGTMMSAYENFPHYFNSFNLNIPGSGNGIPDILDEVLYNLRWMLTMQDPFDGGVYHKCTNAAFDGMVMPGVTKEPRYMVQKSTAATLDFAAVTAQAARVFNKFSSAFPKLADSCLKASVKAWQWAVRYPDILYEQNEMNKTHKPEISTGAYGDRNLADEWLWAASELFVTTKDKKYFTEVEKGMGVPFGVPSWASVGALGYYTLIKFQNTLPAYAKSTVNAMEDSLIKKADELISAKNNNAFNVIMGQSVRDFVWGSNAVASNQGMLLVKAYLLTKDKKYVDNALSNLDYILGRNATGYSFITGYGGKTPMHIHHRQSEADGIIEPVPGFLAGGPNPGRQDKCDYQFTEPETAFVDHVCSYASNEIAINWNAPFVYLVAALEALQR